MSYTLKEITEYIGGEIAGDGKQVIDGIAPFDEADKNEITFASEARFLKRIAECRAAAVIVPPDVSVPGINLIRIDNPYLAVTRLIGLLTPLPARPAGISRQAHISKSAEIGNDVSIGPFAVIGENVKIGARTVIFPHGFIGDDVVIGDDTLIHPGVTILWKSRVGNRVIIQAGSVIGCDGFGFVPGGDEYRKIPHTGIVEIADDVEIGAGNTIDRGTFGKTRICRGVKTDNQVHIAHNVTVGANTVLVAQVGIAGSATIGENVIVAGQAGVSGHISIGNGAIVGPQAGIAQNVPDGQTVSGTPEMPHRLWLRVHRIIPRLPELKKKITTLEKRLKQLEENRHGRIKKIRHNE